MILADGGRKHVQMNVADKALARSARARGPGQAWAGLAIAHPVGSAAAAVTAGQAVIIRRCGRSAEPPKRLGNW